MDRPPFVPVARVAKAHGLAGEVAVIPSGDPAVLVPGLEVWFVPPPGTIRSGTVRGVRPGPKGPLLAVTGVDDIASAHALVGCTIVARPADLPCDWDEKPFDPVGLSVRDEQRGDLGNVEEVIVTGANDVWVVRGDLGEVLIPVIDDVVLDIDERSGTATVRLLPGLLPDTSADR